MYDDSFFAGWYCFPLYDYGAAAGARSDGIMRPYNRGGTLIDYGVLGVQENFAGTTPATIAFGTAADPDAYGEELSLAAATTALGAYSVRSNYDPRIPAHKTSIDALILDNGDIPSGTTPLFLKSTEAVTGPTGQACPFCIIHWAN